MSNDNCHLWRSYKGVPTACNEACGHKKKANAMQMHDLTVEKRMQ